MSLANYTGLKAEIVDWLHRTDLGAVVDTFIDLTESDINKYLRLQKMESRASASTVSEFVTLPNDSLEVRNVQINTNPVRLLRYLSPEAMDSLGDTSGTPAYYTFVGNEIQLSPAPDASTEVEISYYAKIPALSDANPVNFLLVDWPEIYLYGCLYHAAVYIQDAGNAALWKGLYDGCMMLTRQQGKREKWGGNALAVRVL